MARTLSPEQQKALIEFAEREFDLLDTLLSCDSENIRVLTDADEAREEGFDADTIGWCEHHYYAAQRLRTALQKQTVEA